MLSYQATMESGYPIPTRTCISYHNRESVILSERATSIVKVEVWAMRKFIALGLLVAVSDNAQIPE